MSIILKLKRIIKGSRENFHHFGFKVMLAKDICILTNDSLKSTVYKDKTILRYLEKKYAFLIDKYKNCNDVNVDFSKTSDLPIWVFWWQGEEQMPDLIKACHRSKINCSNNHPVVFIDKNNLHEYITIPEYIWEQFKIGKLKIQHLADIIRVRLIKEYGGLWLDGSIYCGRVIPNEVYNLPLYSLKKEDGTLRFVSNNKWTTFLIGGQKNNLLCCFLDEFFMEYCKTGVPFIDYFMFDCAIAMAYKNIPSIRDSIDAIPYYYDDYYWISKHIKNECTNEIICAFEESNAVFYKIAWNISKDKIQEKSFYDYLIKKGRTNV